MDKLDRNEMENMAALHGDRVKPFVDYMKVRDEFVFEQFEFAVQQQRRAKLDVIEQVVDDVFVVRNGLIPTVIAGTATTVPMKYSPEHHRILSREALSTFFQMTHRRRLIAQLRQIAKGGN